MKGASAIVASVMLVLIAVVASVFISGWLSNTTERETATIKNSTMEQIQCQYADIYIRSAAYDCGGNCSENNAHTTTVTVVNSGKRALSMDRIFIANTTGSVSELMLNETTTLDVGDTKILANVTSSSCDGINHTIEYIRASTITCPNAYDNFEGGRMTYQNC